MRRWVIVVSIILLASSGAAYRSWVKTSGPINVEVAEVYRGAITASFTADGVVKGKTVEIAPKVTGLVEALPVTEGQAVRRGQVLVRLEDRELRAAVHEQEAAAQGARMALAQAEAALALSRQQAASQEAAARAQLSAAQAQLQQALAGARSQEIAQAQQQVDMAQATLAAAEQTLRRARDLYAMGAISRADLDEAETRYQVAHAQYRAAIEGLDLLKAGARPEEIARARAQVASAQAQVEAARSARHEVRLRQVNVEAARAYLAQAFAAVERVRALLAGTTVSAPFDGTVSQVAVEVGQLVSPAFPIVTLVDARDPWISADIADEDAAKVSAGQAVVVTVPAYPGRRFPGRVIEVAPQAEMKLDAALRTRIVRVKVKLLQGGDVLRPGLEVDVEGESAVVASALVVPSDALLFRENRNVVFVVDGHIARLREVEVGYSTYGRTEILAGLNEGDLVVVTGKDALTDGRRVRITRTNGL